VLIISAPEGVQAHTELIWQALRAQKIPTLFFANKMDRAGADADGVTAAIATLTDRAVLLQEPRGAVDMFAGVQPRDHQYLVDRLASLDLAVLERYVETGDVTPDYLHERLRSAVAACEAFPVLFGSAKLGIGMSELLDGVADYLPAPPHAAVDHAPAGVVFKLDHDAVMGRVAYVRLFGGRVRARDLVHNATQGHDRKVTQIRKMYARVHEELSEFAAGDIAAVCGLGQVRAGDVLGDPASVPHAPQVAMPLLSVRVRPIQPGDFPRLLEALQQLSDEDPLLDLQWIPEVRELHIKVMGTVQVEILQNMLHSRFHLDALFDPPTVIYRETPARAGEGYEAYTMPKPCWAILRFLIEPGPRGSGLAYGGHVPANRLLPAYQREVERRVPEALKQGLLGWQVTDLRVTLIDGEHHLVHTHPLDWSIATPMAIMNGLANTGTILLEPLYQFRLTVPEECSGKVLGDLLRMRATISTQTFGGTRSLIEGSLPVATSLDYPAHLGMVTGGRGVLTTRYGGYQPAPTDVHATRDRIGVNPLDRAKFILAMRGAL
jgi:ribosomal protection tetracycline resistance protein